MSEELEVAAGIGAISFISFIAIYGGLFRGRQRAADAEGARQGLPPAHGPVPQSRPPSSGSGGGSFAPLASASASAS